MTNTAHAHETPTERIAHVANGLGVTLLSTFVPWSKSRNAKEKHPSLNWTVTLRRGERDILTTDYMAGMGHAPSYSQRQTLHVAEAIKFECETGHKSREHGLRGNPIKPKFADVIYSLVSDASVIDAPDLGYDPDSRTAEMTYRACVDIALKLRNGLGDDGLKALQAACQDY